MNKLYSILIACIGFISLNAQSVLEVCDCDGLPGTIVSLAEPGTYNDSYNQYYIMVDAAGEVLAVNTDGTGSFGAVPTGVYDIYALNYNPADEATIAPLIAVGEDLFAVLAVGSGTMPCYDLVGPAVASVNQCIDTEVAISYTAFCASDGSDTPAILGTATTGVFAFNPAVTDGATIDAATGVISNAVSDTDYTIEWTTTADCPQTVSATAAAQQADDASFSFDDYCVGAANAATIIGTTGGAFSFDPAVTDGATIDGATGEITDGVAETIYGVRYTTTGTCSTTAIATVTVLPIESAAFTFADFCEGAANGATITGTTGGTFSFDPVVTDGATINAVTGEITGAIGDNTYGIRYTTAGTCFASALGAVFVSPSESAAFNFPNFCEGAANGATITGTTGGVFSFDPAVTDGATIDGATGEITDGVAGTAYGVRYTTTGTCSATAMNTVTVLTTGSAAFTFADFCEGAANGATITGTTGGVFSFDPAVTDGATIDGATGEITDGVAGTAYEVEYTTGGDCPASTIESVTVLNSDASFTMPSAVCPFTASGNDAATITGSTGGTFAFNPAATDGAVIDAITGAIGNATPLALYTVEYTTPTGPCQSSSTQIVTVEASLGSVTVNYEDVCFETGVSGLPTIMGGNGTSGGTFSWNNDPTGVAVLDASTGEISNVMAGQSYFVRYESPGVCPSITAGILTVNAPDEAAITYADFCADESSAVPVLTGELTGSFAFNPAVTDGATIDAATGIIANATAGSSYNVAYTTVGDCPIEVVATVAAIDCSNPNILSVCNCDGSPGTLISIAEPGTYNEANNQYYLLVDSDGLILEVNTDETGTFSDIATGTYDIYALNYPAAEDAVIAPLIAAGQDLLTNLAIGSGTNPCYELLGPAEASVNQCTTDVANIEYGILCEGGDTDAPTITGTATGTFAFDPAVTDGASVDALTGVISGGVANASYTVVYTTTGECSTFDSDTVTFLANEDASFSLSDYCEGAANSATITGIAGGIFAFVGTVTDGASVDAGTGEITDGVAGATYLLSYTTAGDCSASTTTDVSVLAQDNAGFTLADFCEGTANSATITGTTGGVFSFTTAVTDGATIDASTGELTDGVLGTTYSVTYTTSGDCPDSSAEELTVSATDDASFAYGDVCQIIATNPTSVATAGGTWSFDPVPTDGAAIDAASGELTGQLENESYTIVYTTSGDCSASSMQTITVNPSESGLFTHADFCLSDGMVTPVPSTPGGTFSFDPVPTDGATLSAAGVISNAVAGTTYGIQYVSPGPCTASSTQDVTALADDEASISYVDFCADGSATVVQTGAAGSYSFTTDPADGASIDASTGEITNAIGGTAYGVSYTTSGDCPTTATATATALADDEASISYDDFCANGTGSVTQTGAAGSYSFTTDPADGAAIDGTTGDITSAVAGTSYDVTYTTSGACPTTATATATALADDEASIAYDDFCANESGLPIQTGPAGSYGFTTDPVDGASIDGSSGEITGGVVGTSYDVTYTTSGACPTTATATANAVECSEVVIVTDICTCNGDDPMFFAPAEPGTFNENADFTQVYLIADADGVILSTSTDGGFDVTGYGAGSYLLYALNYETIDGLTVDDAILAGEEVSALVNGDIIGCYDIQGPGFATINASACACPQSCADIAVPFALDIQVCEGGSTEIAPQGGGFGSAAVFSDFDGCSTETSYGDYQCDGFITGNSIISSTGSSQVGTLPSQAVRIRNQAGSFLAYVGVDGAGKDGGVGTVCFDYHAWDPSPPANMDVEYSTDGSTWINVGTVMTASTSYEQFCTTINVAGDDITVRIINNADNGERLHVDNFSITDYDPTSALTYNFYDDELLTNLLASGSSYDPAATATVYVTAAVDDCESAAIAVAVQVDAAPSATLTTELALCNADDGTLPTSFDLASLITDGPTNGAAIWTTIAGDTLFNTTIDGAVLGQGGYTYLYIVAAADGSTCPDFIQQVAVTVANCTGDPCDGIQAPLVNNIDLCGEGDTTIEPVGGGIQAGSVFETFDDLFQSSYGNYIYNGFALTNCLVSNQNALDGNAVRLRNNTGSTLAFTGLDGNGKDGGLGVISFAYRSWDDSPAAEYNVDYSTDAGMTWINAGTINTTAVEYDTFSAEVNVVGDNILVRVINIAGERLHVDNFSLTDYDETGSTVYNYYSDSALQNLLATGNSFDPMEGGTYFITATEGECESGAIAMMINIASQPSAEVTPSAELCNLDNGSLDTSLDLNSLVTSPVVDGFGIWTDLEGNALAETVIDAEGMEAGTLDFVYTVISFSTACTPVEYPVSITVNQCDPLPTFPGISIIIDDADDNDDTQTVPQGASAVFTVWIQNTGDEFLTDIQVNAPGSDCYFIYDDNLAPGNYLIYTCVTADVQDDFMSTVSVTGESSEDGESVTATDDTEVIVTAPEIMAAVLIDVNDADDGDDTQEIELGGSASFFVTVTNTGNTPLFDLEVLAAQGLACDFSYEGELLPGESFDYECAISEVMESFTLSAEVTANYAGGMVTSVDDDDATEVVVIQPQPMPAIVITKSNAANGTDFQVLNSGQLAVFSIEVVNTGDDSLSNVTVTDPASPECNFTYEGVLAPGEGFDYECAVAVFESFTNEAFVTADGTNEAVSDSDISLVEVVQPNVCEDFVVTADAVCENDESGYIVLVNFEGGSPGANGYNIINEITGVAISNVLEGPVVLGPFPNESSFSYTVEVADNPVCSETKNGTIVNCVFTAIELLSFEGKAEQNGNVLYWSTASEFENDFFTLYRSDNDGHFNPITEIDGAGNSNVQINYFHLDKDAPNGTAYYRLDMTDFQGRITQSEIISIYREATSFQFNISPIPAQHEIQLSFSLLANQAVQAAVYDVAGRLIETQRINATEGQNSETWSVAQYPNGTYYMTITSSEGVTTQRFVKE